MTREDRPAKGRANNQEPDPLDAALRQMGAEILEEPIPERLRELLRRARGGSNEESEVESGRPKSGTGRG